MGATAKLLVAHPHGDKLIVVDGGRLPRVPVENLYQASSILGVEIAIVRTQARLGDDRVVATDLLGDPDRLPDGLQWFPPDALRCDPEVGAAVEAWLEERATDDVMARLPWERSGWLVEALAWADAVAAEHGRRLGPPVQLRHWGLSAVFQAFGRR